MKNTIFAILFSAALAGSCFGQRRYTVTALPSPTSDNNSVAWVSEDGSTTMGVLQFPNPNQNPGPGQGAVPYINECYSLANGQLTLYPSPGLSCGVNGVNKNLGFTGTFFTPNILPVNAYVNLNGSYDVYGGHLPGLDYNQYPACAPNCTVPLSQSLGINDNGDVVGTVNGVDNNAPRPAGSAPPNWVQYSFLYSGGQLTRLPDGFTAFAINNNGDIAGYVTDPDGSPNPPYEAAIYRNGNVIRLGSLGGPTANLSKINNRGQAVGFSSLRAFDPTDLTSLIGKPFFFDGQNMLPIDVPGAVWGASVSALNDSGEAGGTFYVDNNGCGLNDCHYTYRAFYYANGKSYDLNSLLVNPPAGLVLRSVTYISNSGLILANGRNDDNSWSPTYLLTPVPDSSDEESAARHRRTH